MNESLRLRMSVLTDESYEKLRKAVEHVISDIGFVVNNQTILDAFEKAGASVAFAVRCRRAAGWLV